MGLLAKLGFGKKEGPIKITVQTYQVVHQAIEIIGPTLPPMVQGSFNAVLFIVNDIYKHLGFLRAAEEEVVKNKDIIRELSYAGKAKEVKEQLKIINYYDSKARDSIKLIRSNFIMLKVKLDTLQKSSKETVREIKEQLASVVFNLGSEVRLTKDIMTALLP